MAKTTGLDGQGISALFGSPGTDELYFECPINQIVPNKHQPRMAFDQEELDELAESIRVNGVIQPLLVSRLSKKKFGLIAGERRLRAARMAGLTTVPVVVREVGSEDEMLEFALIENIQRTDLNALEEAEAYRRLIDNFGLTQEEAAAKVGKNRSTVANSLRLLQLPDYVKEDLFAGQLSEGHARALLAMLSRPASLKEIRDRILAQHLSVRQTEQVIKSASQEREPGRSGAARGERGFSPSIKKSFENRLANRLGSRVAIRQSGSRGKIEIDYYSYDDLERIIDAVVGEAPS